MRNIFAVVAAVLVTAGWVAAQPLIDKVPDDAVLYIGWQGTEAMPKGYEGSHLKGMAEAADLKGLCNEFLPAVMQRIGQEDRNIAQVTQLVSAVASQVMRRPTALYVGPGDFSNPQQPMPAVALFCEAGKDAPALAGQLQKAMEQGAAGAPFPITAAAEGNLVIVTIGELPVGDKLRPLGLSPKFKEAMAQVVKEPVVVYLDIESALKVVEQIVAHDRGAARTWPPIREALGIDGAKRLAWAGGFDGKDWTTQAFLAAPGARTGLLKLIDAKALGDDVLKVVPQTATMMGAGQLDLAALFAEARTAIGKIDAGAAAQFDQAMQQVREIIGLDVSKDVLEPLGPAWVIYSDPTVGGTGMLGTVMVNRLRDPAAAEKSLARLAEVANGALRQALGREKITLRFEQLKSGDITVNYLAAPLLTPAWAIKDGNLYMSLYPQITATAAQYKGKSILENEQFLAVRKRLGSQAATGISFIDLPKTAPQTYPSWLLISRVTGFGDLFGVKSPMLMPPLPKVMEHLAPAGSVTWTDGAGWHMKTVSPFPGAEVFGTDPMSYMGAQVPLMVSVLLPSLNRARESANRVKCASNLRQIGQAMMLHAMDNKQQQYPPDLGTLVATQDISAQVFICPTASGVKMPAGNLKPEELTKWVNENADYVYLGKGKSMKTPPDEITVYEKFDNHGGDGINMLFADGHVEFVGIAQARKMIDEQTKKK